MTTHCTPLGLQASFGFGDRIGLATPGHIDAMNRAGKQIVPIYPQQSIREMFRTSRTPQQVMDDALSAAEQCNWTGPIGADADHLKTTDDIDVTAAVGFTFFTIDHSGAVDQQADNYDQAELRAKFNSAQTVAPWLDSYRGRIVKLPSGSEIVFDQATLMRAAVKYGAAIAKTIELGNYIDRVHQKLGRPYEIELSVDETDQPTTLAEHFIIADQCLLGGLKLVSLAPRFIGDFEKGVDFKGDISLLRHSLIDHAAIVDLLAPYKISLHSGSDKLSMYGALAAATNGRFHVKTAGTSYLEALRVVAKHNSKAFRGIIDFARDRYDTDKATYHVSATLKCAPCTSDASDLELEQEYLERWDDVPQGKGFTKPGRQILHCTFGSTLCHPEWGPLIRGCLADHPDTYCEVLSDHFVRHLEALQC